MEKIRCDKVALGAGDLSPCWGAGIGRISSRNAIVRINSAWNSEKRMYNRGIFLMISKSSWNFTTTK